MANIQYLSAGIVMGLAGFWAALALWLIGKSRLEWIGRNPESAKASFLAAIIALALSEAIGIYGLVVALMLISAK